MIVLFKNGQNDRQIVKDLITMDTSNSCFLNKDMEGNIIPIEDVATIYLEYTKMYGDKMENLYIGLLAFTNENEISIFLAPSFQNRGLGKKYKL